MLDRLLRGRAWIGLLGVLLIGLVALNVSLLKLNATAGRNAEVAKKLRIQNADLRGRVSRLGSSEHLQKEAEGLGFVMPTAGDVHYLAANPALDAKRAAHHAELSPLPFSTDIVSVQPAEPPLPAPLAPASGATGAATPTGTTGTTDTQSVGTAAGAAPTGPTGAQGAPQVTPP
jgi:hypothetical protein